MRYALILLLILCTPAFAGYSGPVEVEIPANAIIKILASNGGDYTDPATWVNERFMIAGTDLTADGGRSEVLQIRSGSYDFTIDLPNGISTSDMCKVIIMAYPGEECTGPTTGARIVWSAPDNGEAIQCYSPAWVYNLGASRPNGNDMPTCGGIWVGPGAGNPAISGGGIFGCYVWNITNSGGNAAGVELNTPAG